jgi:uncharacterized repeat protein (TIGR03843 family)
VTVPEELVEGELVLHGRIMPASNATFVGEVDGVQVVYKPVAGERPLWDFPDGSLADREVAAYLVSQATGWDVVPPTVRREGPHGSGMVQLWREPDPAQEAVTIVPEGVVPAGFRHVFDGVDQHDAPISLVHEDSAPLRRMAVLDVMINNADRKGGHVLEMADGHRHGVDHGVTFHHEHKLRTVLWDFVGEPLGPELLEALCAFRNRLADSDDSATVALTELLDKTELRALRRRLERLIDNGIFPLPGSGPNVPWPPV